MKKIKKFLSLFVLFLFMPSISEINIPDSFGKTHFIVGLDPKKVVTQTQGHCKCSLDKFVESCKSGVRQALFAPDDNILEILTYLISSEKTSIRMAAFLLTDYKIVESLIQSRGRGVDIEIVFDPKAVKFSNSRRARLLKGKGIKVFVYKPKERVIKGPRAEDNVSNIMHNKFIVFGNNIAGKSLLWTGSFNFTYSAHEFNQENVVVFDDFDLVKKFSVRFDYLKNECSYQFGAHR